MLTSGNYKIYAILVIFKIVSSNIVSVAISLGISEHRDVYLDYMAACLNH